MLINHNWILKLTSQKTHNSLLTKLGLQGLNSLKLLDLLVVLLSDMVLKFERVLHPLTHQYCLPLLQRVIHRLINLQPHQLHIKILLHTWLVVHNRRVLQFYQPHKLRPLVSVYIKFLNWELHSQCALFYSIRRGGLTHFWGVKEESEDFGDQVDFPGDEQLINVHVNVRELIGDRIEVHAHLQEVVALLLGESWGWRVETRAVSFIHALLPSTVTLPFIPLVAIIFLPSLIRVIEPLTTQKRHLFLLMLIRLKNVPTRQRKSCFWVMQASISEIGFPEFT